MKLAILQCSLQTPLFAESHCIASIWTVYSAAVPCWEASLLSQATACMSGVSAFQLEHFFPGHIIAVLTSHHVHDMLLQAGNICTTKIQSAPHKIISRELAWCTAEAAPTCVCSQEQISL